MPVKMFLAPRLGIKAGEDDGLGDGQYEQFVSVFGNVDYHGERVLPGSFHKSLQKWQRSGDPIPIVFAHRSDDPEYHIGYALEAKERDFDYKDPVLDTPRRISGLWVRGQLDLDNPKAAYTYRLLKGRRVTNASFGFDIKDLEESEDPEDATKGPYGFPVINLKELELFECGPCLVGANRETGLAVKSYEDAERLHKRLQRVPEPKRQDILLGNLASILKTGS